MNIINMDRGLGKTTLLVAISAEQNIPIVSVNPWYVKDRARQLGLTIPEPMTPQEAQSSPARTVLVDEMDYVLRRLLGTNIEACTISLNDPPPCARYCSK